MSKCLRKDCQVELVNIEGRRPKIFCSSRCRSLHWVKEKTLESKTKRIPIEEWEKLTAELNELRIFKSKMEGGKKDNINNEPKKPKEILNVESNSETRPIWFKKEESYDSYYNRLKDWQLKHNQI